MYTPTVRQVLSRMLPAVLLAFGGWALAQEETNPPARVASLSHVEGSVVFAPAGETEWAEAPLNRPITRGDRLWTDKGSRAEVHAGSAALHMDGQTFLDIAALDEDVLQASLNEGTVNARVRQIDRGENFEIDTPQLAFRATQPGDYRIDVDPAQGTTRVTVRSGAALVYGANGQAQELEGSQVVTFAGNDLERVNVQATPRSDGFDRWAADRNRVEDQSITARYVPREVVGYQQLDTHGTWSEDSSYGAVWYPRAVVADWAPYRYGHWEFISPWGWTWIDDAPWGFAPFHYGRWAMIGSRWAWVPGRIGPRPVYAPALVAFVGGNSFSISFGSDSGIGWFPLGPGEAWHPTWRVSSRYVTRVNRYVATNTRFGNVYVNQQRPAMTTVRMADFRRGQPVHRHWQPVRQGDLGQVRVLPVPSLPQPQRFAETHRPAQMRALPPPQLSAPAMAARPQPIFRGQSNDRRDAGERQRPLAVPRPQEIHRPQQEVMRPPVQPQQQPRFQHERQVQQQEQQERQQERFQREQQVQQQRIVREQQIQQHRQQQEEGRRQQEEGRRQQQVQAQQREHAIRQQQAAQEHAQRQQQHQQQMQQRAIRPPQAEAGGPGAQPRMAPPAVQQQGPRHGEGRERGRPAPEQRDENRSQRGEERGRGHGRFS